MISTNKKIKQIKLTQSQSTSWNDTSNNSKYQLKASREREEKVKRTIGKEIWLWRSPFETINNGTRKWNSRLEMLTV